MTINNDQQSGSLSNMQLISPCARQWQHQTSDIASHSLRTVGITMVWWLGYTHLLCKCQQTNVYDDSYTQTDVVGKCVFCDRFRGALQVNFRPEISKIHSCVSNKYVINLLTSIQLLHGGCSLARNWNIEYKSHAVNFLTSREKKNL